MLGSTCSNTTRNIGSIGLTDAERSLVALLLRSFRQICACAFCFLFHSWLGWGLLMLPFFTVCYVYGSIILAKVVQSYLRRSRFDVAGSLLNDVEIGLLWLRAGSLLEVGIRGLVLPTRADVLEVHPGLSRTPLITMDEMFVELHTWPLIKPLLGLKTAASHEPLLVHIRKMELNSLHVVLEITQDDTGKWNTNFETCMGQISEQQMQQKVEGRHRTAEEGYDHEHVHELELDIKILIDVLTIRDFSATVIVNKKMDGKLSNTLLNTIVDKAVRTQMIDNGRRSYKISLQKFTLRAEDLVDLDVLADKIMNGTLKVSDPSVETGANASFSANTEVDPFQFYGEDHRQRLDNRAKTSPQHRVGHAHLPHHVFRSLHKALSLQEDLDEEHEERDRLVKMLWDIQDSGQQAMSVSIPELATQLGSMLGLKLASHNKKTIFNLSMDKSIVECFMSKIDSDDGTGRRLTVTVVQGRKMLPMDRSGTSDPYASLSMKRQAVDGAKKQLKTRVISKDLNPEWNETFSFIIPMEEHINDTLDAQILCVEVKDKDMLRSEFMGACEIDLSRLPADQAVRKWYPLLKRKNGSLQRGTIKGRGLGDIELILKYSLPKNTIPANDFDDVGAADRQSMSTTCPVRTGQVVVVVVRDPQSPYFGRRGTLVEPRKRSKIDRININTTSGGYGHPNGRHCHDIQTAVVATTMEQVSEYVAVASKRVPRRFADGKQYYVRLCENREAGTSGGGISGTVAGVDLKIPRARAAQFVPTTRKGGQIVVLQVCGGRLARSASWESLQHCTLMHVVLGSLPGLGMLGHGMDAASAIVGGVLGGAQSTLLGVLSGVGEMAKVFRDGDLGHLVTGMKHTVEGAKDAVQNVGRGFLLGLDTTAEGVIELKKVGTVVGNRASEVGAKVSPMRRAKKLLASTSCFSHSSSVGMVVNPANTDHMLIGVHDGPIRASLRPLRVDTTNRPSRKAPAPGYSVTERYLMSPHSQ